MRSTPSTAKRIASTRVGPRQLAAAVLSALLLLTAASAALADNVTVSFDITAAAGGLTVAAAAGSADIGDASYNSGSATGLTGDMPNLTVTDARGTLITGWTVTASATAWSDGGSETVTAANGVVFFPVADVAALITGSTLNNMNLLACACSATGATALVANNLGTPYTLATGIATGLLTTPTATFSPDLYVSIPANKPVGTYTNTVTYSAT